MKNATAQNAGEPKGSSRPLILVIDDEEACRTTFASCLERADYRVLTASAGTSALEILEAETPDLVLVDALMPEMDGYELVRKLRTTPRLAGLPVIMCSGAFTEDEGTELARRCGISRFLSKASVPAVLVESVGAVLQESAESTATGADERFDSDYKQLLSKNLREKVGVLEQSEAQLSLLLKSVTDYGIVLLSVEGVVLSWNPGAEQITGLKESQARGRCFSSLLGTSNEAGAEAKRILAAVMEKGRYEQSCWRRYADQRNRWIELTVTAVDESPSRFRGFAAVIRDLTTQHYIHEEREGLLEKLRALTHRFELVREEERARIARDLHDELGQSLTALKMDLANLEGLLPASTAPLRGQCSAMHGLIDHTLKVVQQIASELRLGHLNELGLGPAIEWQIQEFQRRSGLECVINRLEEPENLPEAQGTAVYRIVQEALTNVARHAGATRVQIRLWTEGNVLLVEVEDNGKGITPEQIEAKRSTGLAGMRERAHAWSGDVHVQGGLTGGTLVKLQMPLARGGNNSPNAS